jgi:hypothetical protein
MAVSAWQKTAKVDLDIICIHIEEEKILDLSQWKMPPS